jgi:Cupin-like domain
VRSPHRPLLGRCRSVIDIGVVMSTCKVCAQPLASSDARAVRQHAKSRAHRTAVAALAATADAAEAPRPPPTAAATAGTATAAVDNDSKSAAVINNKATKRGKRRGRGGAGATAAPCIHCGHPSEAHLDDDDHHHHGGSSSGVSPCLPPEFVRTPRPVDWSMPFVTGWRHAAHWQGEDWPTEHVLEWGCRPGNWRRLPNVDLDRKNVAVETFAHAETLIADHRANHATKPIWVSFDAADELEHPSWFLATPNGSPPVQLVPTYSNVLVTLGPSVSIGLHQDTDNRELSSSSRPPTICTYLTVAQGAKHVVLVPPKTSPEDLRLFKSLWMGPTQPDLSLAHHAATDKRTAKDDDGDAQQDESGTEEDDTAPSFPFNDPSEPAAQVQSARERLRRARGYLFRLSEGQTLLIPRGWYHWIVAEHGTSVTLSGSRY